MLPAYTGVSFTSIITANDSINGNKMSGIPDGLGAYDNGDGTFTLLMNHEFVNMAGTVRAHGSIGAYASKWVINKQNLSVVSGSDLMKYVYLWNEADNTLVRPDLLIRLSGDRDFKPVNLQEIPYCKRSPTRSGLQATN